MQTTHIHNYHILLKKWVPRLALTAGALTVGLLCLVGWVVYPLFVTEEGASIPAFEFDNTADRDNNSTRFSVQRFALGWFHSTEPMKQAKRILVLGFDQNDNHRPGRTDTMMVVEVHPQKGVGILSIPRDLWVYVPASLEVNGSVLQPELTEKEQQRVAEGPEFGRINTIYRLGNRRFGKGKGHVLLKKVLKDELDVEIDYTMAVNYEGFQQIIDALGGVEVDVQCPIRDNFISDTSPTGYELLDVPAGVRRMTGHEALLFMRSRHGRTDMDRSRRQQRVLLGLREQLFADGAFLILPRVVSTMMPYVKLDMDLATILRFAVTLKSLDRKLHGMVLTPPLVDRMETADKQSVLVLNKEKFLKKKAKLYASPLPGEVGSGICPDVDVALHWKDRKADKADKAEE